MTEVTTPREPTLREGELDKLKEKLEQLKDQRSTLKNAIRDQAINESLLRLIAKELENGAQINDDALSELQAKLVDDIVTGYNKRNVDQLAAYYRLAGRTVFPAKNNQIVIRLESFYGGRYLEPYYLILLCKDGSLAIHRHTIPHFIPLNSLVKDYLNHDIHTFLDKLHQQLLAFVSRREQMRDLERAHADKSMDFLTSPAHDVIQISMPQVDGSIQLNVFYDQLWLSLPSRVTIIDIHTTRQDSKRKTTQTRLEHLESVFLEFPLLTAFDAAFVDEGEMDQQPDVSEQAT